MLLGTKSSVILSVSLCFDVFAFALGMGSPACFFRDVHAGFARDLIVASWSSESEVRRKDGPCLQGSDYRSIQAARRAEDYINQVSCEDPFEENDV
jgi:hypothetical protein